MSALGHKGHFANSHQCPPYPKKIWLSVIVMSGNQTDRSAVVGSPPVQPKQHSAQTVTPD